jgi:hypothetical protein
MFTLDKFFNNSYICYICNYKGGVMNLNIRGFPDDLYREAKIQAAIMGVSLKEIVIRALKDYLKKQKK